MSSIINSITIIYLKLHEYFRVTMYFCMCTLLDIKIATPERNVVKRNSHHTFRRMKYANY